MMRPAIISLRRQAIRIINSARASDSLRELAQRFLAQHPVRG